PRGRPAGARLARRLAPHHARRRVPGRARPRMARLVARRAALHQARLALVIALVPTGPEHAEAIQRLAGHPDIAAMTPIPHPYPEDGAARFVRNVVLPGRAAGTFYGFVIEAGGEVVGHIGLKNVDRARGAAELGYWVGRPFWGRGYASEA